MCLTEEEKLLQLVWKNAGIQIYSEFGCKFNLHVKYKDPTDAEIKVLIQKCKNPSSTRWPGHGSADRLPPPLESNEGRILISLLSLVVASALEQDTEPPAAPPAPS